MDIGTRQRQRNARKTGSTADIADSFAAGDQLAYSGAIHHVTVPQPADFRGSDQAALDSVARENLRVTLRQLGTVAKNVDGGGRWGRSFTMFHVKQPPLFPPARRRRTTSM
jgi:hypothetical protein